jgi:hypothetical protein
MAEQERTKQLLDFYYRKRIKRQLDYFRDGTLKYENTDRWLRIGAGFLLLLSGFLSSLLAFFQAEDSTNQHVIWGVLLLAVPVLSTALLTVRSVLGVERLHKLYGRVRGQLSQLEKEEKDIAAAPDPEEKLKDYISRTEGILAAENFEWLGEWKEVQPVDAASITGRAETD